MSKQAEVAADWKARGFSCGLFEDPPGRCWEDYVHDVDELFMVLEGTMELVIGNQTIHPKIEEEILIPAKITHSVRNIGDTPSRWLYGYKHK